MVLGDPCQKQACNIQKCLQANHYNEEACGEFFKDMDKCCEKWGAKSGCCYGFLKDQGLKKRYYNKSADKENSGSSSQQ